MSSTRGPQSKQSVPRPHRLNSEPSPPSSHTPSLTIMLPIARQESTHASKHLPLS